MKVIFFNRFFHPDTSATSQILSDLAFHLAECGNEVHVVTSRGPKGELALENIGGLTVHRVTDASHETHSLVHRALAYLRFYVAARKIAADLITTGDIVVLKTDPPMLSAVVGAIAVHKGARLVNWLQDVFPEVAHRYGIPGAGGITGNLLRKIRNRSFRRASRIVVIGDQMARYVKSQGIGPVERIEVIHNWANGDEIRPVAPEDNSLRREWMLGRAFVVGYSGNLGRVHEFDTLLEAARRLRDSEPEIRFVIVGRGPRLQETMTRAHGQGLGNVAFKPHLEKGSLSMSLAVPDVHISTLRPAFEGLVQPSKLYGVMAAGRPTIFIGDPQGETARILEETCSGITILPGNGEALAAAIRQLRDDPVRRKEMGANARAAFEARFDRRLALAKWEALLKAVSA